jgi:benzoyl-CoA reductase subunit C
VIRNLSGMWKLQFPEKLSRYFDVPQNFDLEVGGRFYRRELLDLAAELERRGARPYDAAALRASIELYNGVRRRVRELYQLRRDAPWQVPTAELYLLLRAGLVLPAEEFAALLDAYRAAAFADQERKPLDQARVVLTGSFCEQPPLGLIKTLERSGCYIVDDDFLQIHRWIRGDVASAGDPLDNLVGAFLNDAIDSPTRYLAVGEKGRGLVERVRAAAAEGVLFCAPSFCDPALLDQPMATRAIDRAGIPWTAFKYSENSGQFQVIREQAGTFADSIKLWS